MKPESWKIGNRSVVPIEVDDSDPRGILWVWEQPRKNCNYVVSVDPTVGKTGWNRYARTDDDISIDNGVLQVLRCANPDVQVAEYAAPVDAVDLAPIANTLGRIYAGANEDGEALMIGELTGPGAVTIRELIDRFNYTNHWRWTQWGGATTRRTHQFWWSASRSANKDLWMRGLHHIHKRKVKINSPWLVEEMTDCMADVYTLIGEARHGRHDDRVLALMYALWAAHDWSTGDEPQERGVVEIVDGPKWEASDMTLEELTNAFDDRMEQLNVDRD